MATVAQTEKLIKNTYSRTEKLLKTVYSQTEKLVKATNRVDKSLNAVEKAVHLLNHTGKKVQKDLLQRAKSSSKTAKQGAGQKSSEKKEEEEATGLKKKIQTLNKASDAIKKLQKNVFIKGTYDFLKGAVDAANNRINAEQRLVSIMSKTSGMTKEGVNLVRDYVLELEKTSTISNTVGLTGMSQLATHVQNPENLKNLGDSLYDLTVKMHGAKATSENMTAVADVLGQALNGQTDALKKNGITISEQQQKILEYGREAERTAILVELVQGKVGGLAEAMANTPEGKILQLKNAWTKIMEIIGFGLIPIVTGFIDILLTNMPFVQTVLVAVFNVLTGAAELLNGAISWLFQAIQSGVEIAIGVLYNLGAVLVGLLPFILAGAAVWGVFYLAINYTSVATRIYLAIQNVLLVVTNKMTKAMKVLNMVFRMNPIGFVVGLVVALISAFIYLQQSTVTLKQIFSSAFGFIMDVAESAINFVISLINGLIKGFNSVAGFFGNLLGLDIQEVKEIEIRADFSKVKEAGQDFIENFSLEDLKEKLFTPPEMPDPFGMDALPDYGLPGDEWSIQSPDDLGDIGKVGEVGKIRDTVDISSEDIKMMRELAEMKNIQNFVSLTPSVSVQTGDITSGHDIDTIVKRITTTLETEIAAGAKGVWKV